MPRTRCITHAVSVAADSAVEVLQTDVQDRAALSEAGRADGTDAFTFQQGANWAVRVARKANGEGVTGSSDRLGAAVDDLGFC
jgi:hypothetical protein